MKTFDKKREKSKTCRPGQHSFGILSESTELGFFFFILEFGSFLFRIGYKFPLGISKEEMEYIQL